jgi:hypothetical protein
VFTAPAGELRIGLPYTGFVAANTVDLEYYGGTFQHNNGTVKFVSLDDAGGNYTHDIKVSQTLTVNNLWFNGGNQGLASWSYYYTLTNSGSGSALLAGGNVWLQPNNNPAKPFRYYLNGSTLEVAGNLVVSNNVVGGTTQLKLSGGNEQTISHLGGTVPGTAFTIAKSGGTVTLATAVDLVGASYDLAWTGGGLNLSSNQLKVGRNVTIGTDATTLGVTVADATKAGKLWAVGTASDIANVGLLMNVAAAPETVAGQTYTIFTNNASLGASVFESVTWAGNGKGVVAYTNDSGKTVTISGIVKNEAGSIFRLR